MPTAKKKLERRLHIRRTGIVLWRDLGPVMDRIVRELPLKISVDGLQVAETSRGLHLQS